MIKMKLKKGDTVKILSGKDKGKTGKILAVFPSAMRAVVEGVNVHTSFVKSRGDKKPGGRMSSPSPLRISKLQLIDQSSGKPTRVGFRQEGNVNQRVSKKTGKLI